MKTQGEFVELTTQLEAVLEAIMLGNLLAEPDQVAWLRGAVGAIQAVETRQIIG